MYLNIITNGIRFLIIDETDAAGNEDGQDYMTGCSSKR
jgi:hypothetical protein